MNSKGQESRWATGRGRSGKRLGAAAQMLLSHGRVVLGSGGGDVVYTPETGFSGTDNFTYTISDGALTATATVSVIVSNNRQPLAINDSLNVPAGSSNNPLDVLWNDTDLDRNNLSVTAVTPAANGTVAIDTGGWYVIYTPNPGFSGTEGFTYTISDGGMTASAAVAVTVHQANNPPLAINDAVTVPIDSSNSSINVLANDSDSDGDAVSVLSVTQGTNGTVTVGAGRLKVLYTPKPGFSGTDSFLYTISGGVLSDAATINVTVSGVRRFLPFLSTNFSAAWSAPRLRRQSQPRSI